MVLHTIIETQASKSWGSAAVSRAKPINLRAQHSLEGFHLQRLAEQYHDCICLFVPWVAPAGIKPIIIVLLFKLRSVYTHIKP